MYRPVSTITSNKKMSSFRDKKNDYVSSSFDFPELSKSVTKQLEPLNFKTIVMDVPREVPKILIDYSSLPGWTCIDKWENNKIRTESLKKQKEEEEEEEDENYNELVYYNIMKMAENWDMYRYSYSELYGNELYHHYYEMPDCYYQSLENDK